MRILLFPVVFMVLSWIHPAIAGQTEYDECILKYLKNAKLDVATHLIKSACNENYKSPNFTAEKRRPYNHCLLEHLTGVESIQAVMEIKAACGSKHK